MTDMSRASFDNRGFFGALDATRLARKLTWKDVATEAEVSASTLTRMGQGKRPDVDTLCALCAWSGLDATHFMRGRDPQAEPDSLAAISRYIRIDPNLTPTSADILDDLVKSSYQRLRSG